MTRVVRKIILRSELLGSWVDHQMMIKFPISARPGNVHAIKNVVVVFFLNIVQCFISSVTLSILLGVHEDTQKWLS